MYSTADLQLFIRTADTGNLSQAARDLELSTATASASLKRLEQKLGTRLFVRSTRSMRLTQDGEIFLEYGRNALALLKEGEALIAADRNAIRGNIRISAPSDLGRSVLLPWLNEFQHIHPGITITVQLSDSNVDLFREPVDMAFRYGKQQDSTLVSQHLIDNRRTLVASPAYIKKHPPLQSPRDLVNHNCLLYFLKHGLNNTWPFWFGKELMEVKVRGDRMANDGAVVREWALAGLGIAYKSRLDVKQDLDSGKLVVLLPNYLGDQVPLNAVYPHRNSASPRIRALLIFLREKFAAFEQAAGVGR
ncbi:LysR family transcriptional regulator [Undibacterium sp.]|jgi:DNA-binding transcriptional LysR family regulator|uniref:LysR family transcriptional regulator n=1 Tax=Undibacterium sp. TaxID=1914977 RepID=UPI002C71168F|nr:LysR family transcriptional regulator [Undibacterium sp.]HTD05125.1 LysR family transcriptional regulator [Undibacterium sp.]